MTLHQDTAILTPVLEQTPIMPTYTMQDREAILHFLAAYPSLTSLLLEVYPAIERYFGNHVPVTLQLLHDPEEGSVGPLFALIQATDSVLETQCAVDRFDNKWWMDHPAQAISPLIIGLK